MEWPWPPPASFSCEAMELMRQGIILSWPLKMKRRELNRNSPPVMWHGVVGADDNSFLVVVTSRQKFPYNKFRFINRDFQSRENRTWKLPRLLQCRMTRSVHVSKRRELDVEDVPLCLHLGVKCGKSRKMCVENNATETRHKETQ